MTPISGTDDVSRSGFDQWPLQRVQKPVHNVNPNEALPFFSHSFMLRVALSRMTRRIVPVQEGAAVALRRSTRVQSMSTSVARTAVIQETQNTLISDVQATVSTETQIEIQETSRPKRRRKSSSGKTKPEVTTGGAEEAAAGDDDATVKPKKRRRVKEEPVYIIPDVEKKETTFKGRLGESNSFRILPPTRLLIRGH